MFITRMMPKRAILDDHQQLGYDLFNNNKL
jgi:hypothetical protein